MVVPTSKQEGAGRGIMSVVSLPDEELLGLAKRVIQQDILVLESIQGNLGDEFCACARKLASCTGIIWITGVGTSAYVGQRFAHILTCSGVRSMFLSPIEGLHGHSGIFRPMDLLVVISRGGESEEVVEMAQIAHRLSIPVMALVQNLESRLAKLANLVLPIQSPDEYELGGYLATTSTVVVSAICDAICAVILRERGNSLHNLVDTHPGGAVGRFLRSKSKPHP